MMMNMDWNQMGRMRLTIEWPSTPAKLDGDTMVERVYVFLWKL
jgi:hypothetical protein